MKTIWILDAKWIMMSASLTLISTGCTNTNSDTASTANEASAASPLSGPNATATTAESLTTEKTELAVDHPPTSALPARHAVSRESTRLELPGPLASKKVHVPQVMLSEKYAATCLRKVGDTLLGLSFQSVAPPGESIAPQTLDSLLGERLTVVVFSDAAFDESVEQVLRLETEVLAPYKEFGVSVVAIQVGETTATANIPNRITSDIPILIDSENAYRNISTMSPPRTYLLDASGNILWLDIEYSRGMRTELDNAIRFHLKQLFDTASRNRVDLDWH